MERFLLADNSTIRRPLSLSYNILLSAVMAFSLLSAQSHAAEGRTAGTFSISPVGAATYSIPIFAPPGPQGIQPHISLTYSSQGSGIGPLGVGWSIGGLSQIARCDFTVAQNGRASQVVISPTDPTNVFCLDGQKLRVTSGAGGFLGSTYQTEVADFAQVTMGGSLGAPYFTVQARNGVTYQYGYTDANGNGANSRVRWSGPYGGGSLVGQWLLSKVTDRAGNNYVINYTSLGGTAVPKTIEWTATGSSSYAYTMTFNYPNPNAPQSSIYAYAAGTPVVNSDLLTSITVSYFTTIVKNYVLGYEASPTTARKRLVSITECADSGASNCLLPSKITYQNGTVGVSASPSTAISTSSQRPLGHYDLNGDGYPDLVYASGGEVYVSFWVPFESSGLPSTYGPPVDTGITSANLNGVCDLLGNGVDGIVANNGGTWFYYTFNGAYSLGGTGFSSVTMGLNYSGPNTLFMDVDGDGLPDFITWTAPTSGSTAGLHINSQLNISVGSSTGGAIGFSTVVNDMYDHHCYNSCAITVWDPNNAGSSPLRAWDFKGDGTSDLLFIDAVPDGSGNYQLTALFSQTNAGSHKTVFSEYPVIPINAGVLPTNNTTLALAPPFVADWNGDGCADIIWYNRIVFSGCDGTFQSPQTVGATPVAVIDWDGDGRSDLLVANGNFFGVYLSTGLGVAPLAPTTVPYSSNCSYFVTDIDNDGLDDLGCWNYAASPYPVSYYLHNSPGVFPDLAISIADGYGNSASPTYESYGVNCNVVGLAIAGYKGTCAPFQLVNRVTFSDPSNATSTYYQYFDYGSAETNLQGRGFSGFGQFYQYDSRNQTDTYNFLSVIFPTIGMGSTMVQNGSGGGYNNIFEWDRNIQIVTLDTTANNQRYFAYYNSVTELDTDPSITYLPPKTTTTTATSFDNYGNLTSQVKTITDNDSGSPYVGYSWTTSVTNTPDISTSNAAADLAAWCLPVIDQTQTVYSSTLPGSTSVTRTQTFTPDTPANCRVTAVITEPSSNGGLYKVTEGFVFDNFGNVETDTVTGANMPSSPASRVTTMNWGATGQFLNSVTVDTGTVANPTTATNSWAYTSNQSLTFGIPDSLTDPNNLKTSWTYDNFGRKIKEVRPDTKSNTWAWSACTSSCGWGNSIYQVTQTAYATDGSTKIRVDTVNYDPIDRAIQTAGPTVTGAIATVQTQYNSLGLVSHKSMPFLSGTPYQQSFYYDVLNRLTSVTRPISSTKSTLQTSGINYTGRTTKFTDPYGHTKTTVTDVNGWMRQTKDAVGYSITNAYDSAGSLIGTTDSAGNSLLKSVTYAYGIKPFLLGSTDADLGVWSYTVDSLGERTGWKDAKLQSFSMTYDALSRPLTRTEPDLFTQWTWGSTAASYNVGQLIEECTQTSSPCSGANALFNETRTFDTKGRLSTRAITEAGNPGKDAGGAFQFTYAYGTLTTFLSAVTYPISTSGVPALNVHYGYQNGLLQNVTDTTDTTSTCGSTCTLWTANAMNAFGQVTQETLGNGVVINRTYDGVTSWLSAATGGVGGGATLLNQSYLQDENGNVIERQNNNLGLTESFAYDADNRMTCTALSSTCTTPTIVYDAGVAGSGNITSQTGLGIYGYAAAGQPQPHAVTSLTGTFNGIVNPHFSYDANGNMTNRASTSQNVFWSSYNYPIAISGSDATGSEEVQFNYGPDRARWKQIYTGPSGVETTYYLGGIMDLVFIGGVANYRHYITAGDKQIAVYNRTAAGNTMSYFLEDHQGGPSSITSKSGLVDVTESFSAFGTRRNPTTWSGAPSTTDLNTIASLSRQGYTNQTWLGQSMGLNHMNGRVQDAILGRFLSPDPNITDPTNAQSYNRYSYVLNNPVTFSDPTGFSNCRKRKCSGGEIAGWSGFSGFTLDFLAMDNYEGRDSGGGSAPNYIGAANKFLFDWIDPTQAASTQINLASSSLGLFDQPSFFDGFVQTYGSGLQALFDVNVLAAQNMRDHPYSTAFGALGEAAGVFGSFGGLSSGVEATSSVFWSGGSVARDAAAEWAAANGGLTLEMSQAGEELAATSQGMNWTQAAPMWEAASSEFASQAVGNVRVFLGPNFSFGSSSIFNMIELPALLRNPNVGNITFHFVYP